jgi:iron(III) transport system permease protein
MKRTVLFWLLVGLAGFAVLPWHMTEAGFFSFEWLTSGASSSGLWLAMSGHWWLAPVGLVFLAAIAVVLALQNPVRRARTTLGLCALGLFWTAL